MAITHTAELSRVQQLGLRVVGAGLLIATGGIHLDLYLTGYNTIPTIGWLFLLQVITCFALGLAVLATGSRLVAAAGAGFALATLGGYLLSIWVGLFGFKEVRTTAGIVAGIIEVVAFVALAMLAALPGAARHRAQQPHSPLLDRLQDGVPGAAVGVGAIAVVALLLLGIAVAGAGSTTTPAATAGGNVQVVTIGGASVLANSKGLTLYTFAPDPANKSVCYGSCAQYWPPVKGPLTAPSGVSGTFATIKRTDGTVQATFNGHPLYTYVGDSGKGQAHGNNLNLNGGLWHEVTTSG
jgi:predicted lipoprotein with Yx(FWY)xxD motif